ncbi:cellulase family glycosylhydrolase [Sinosporangium album]|nr:cellulase family glycosylhydrolase [Sinosporangium album]
MKRSIWVILASAVALAANGALIAAARGEPPQRAPRFVTDDLGRALTLHGFLGADVAEPGATEPGAVTPDIVEAGTAEWGTAGAGTAERGIVDAGGGAAVGKRDSEQEQERRDLGANVVRLPLRWGAVEPSPDFYDTKYLNKVAEHVAWYGRQGYHVILDMRHGLPAPVLPDGDLPDGAPPDGAPPDGAPPDGAPRDGALPGAGIASRQAGVNSDSAPVPGMAVPEQWRRLRAVDDFWTSADADSDLTRRYARAWRAVAARVAREPGVLGYDLMDHPPRGSLAGPAFERGPLAALYRLCVEEIRTVDPDSWIFLEPQPGGVTWGLPSGLPAVDDPRRGEPRIGLAPHLHPPPLSLGTDYTGTARAWTDQTLAWWRDNTLRTAERLNAPVVLGEFGVDMARPGAAAFVEKVLNMTDESGMGRLYRPNPPSGLRPYTADREAEESTAERTTGEHALARAYPRAVAGVPELVRVERGRVTVRLRSDRRISGDTEIYLPPGDFPEGGTLTASAASTVSRWDPARRVLSVTTDPSVPVHTLTVTRS